MAVGMSLNSELKASFVCPRLRIDVDGFFGSAPCSQNLETNDSSPGGGFQWNPDEMLERRVSAKGTIAKFKLPSSPTLRSAVTVT